MTATIGFVPLDEYERTSLRFFANEIRNELSEWFRREERVPFTVAQIMDAIMEAAHRQPWVCPQCKSETRWRGSDGKGGPMVCGRCFNLNEREKP